MPILSGRSFSVEFSTDGTNFTAVPQVETITIPNITYDSETVQLLDSDAQYGQKVILGSTIGDLTVTVAYDPSNSVHTQLDGLVGSEMASTAKVRVKKGESVFKTYSWIGLSQEIQEIAKRSVLRATYTFHVGAPITS